MLETPETLTKTQEAQLAYLREAIAGAPRTTRLGAPDLRGWWVGMGWYVCAACAGRIMDRGCALPRPDVAVWANRPEPFGVCCLCE